MISVVLFAGVVALLALALGLRCLARRRWLEAGVSLAGSIVCAVLAAAGSGGDPPLWLLLWMVWVVIALVMLGFYSFLRAVV
ncbi:hypothetical protein AB0K05_24770 [Nonomuraea sp. NPDC049486]|uniref:hypothetical protein n=1 Tax=Nonomuraea sp. NPDC049486 TaxID=3155773 RepID=UPI0034252167